MAASQAAMSAMSHLMKSGLDPSRSLDRVDEGGGIAALDEGDLGALLDEALGQRRADTRAPPVMKTPGPARSWNVQ